LLLPSAAAGSAGGETRAFVYAPDSTSVIANPGRGYFENFSGFDYLYPQYFDEEYTEWLTDPEYDAWRFGGGYLERLRALRKDGVTVLDANIYLNEYIDSPELPPSFPAELSKALRVVREARMKIILRVVYADDWTPMVVEKNYLRHIEQIGAVIAENADIVEGLCAGILGPWGEWHGDDRTVMAADRSYRREDRPEYQNHAPTTDLNSPEQGARRYRLVKQWLDCTPDTIPLLLRYTENLMEIKALAQDPPEGAAALTQAQFDRLGQHDDAFASYVMSYTRGGGWEEAFYPYWNGGKRYDQVKDVAALAARLETSGGGDVLQAGEAGWWPYYDRDLGIDDPLADTAAIDAGARLALSEAAARKFTLINRAYDVKHLDFWKNAALPAAGGDPAESAYTRLDRKLGYRLRLESAEFTTGAGSEDIFTIRAALRNDGYAGVVRPRPLFIVFDNGVNRYDVELTDVDVRTWRSGVSRLDASVSFPAGMQAGEYAVALWLPDHYENLRGLPEYSVRLANKDIWRGDKGYNYLGAIKYQGRD
jgi:hypothetical protein